MKIDYCNYSLIAFHLFVLILMSNKVGHLAKCGHEGQIDDTKSSRKHLFWLLIVSKGCLDYRRKKKMPEKIRYLTWKPAIVNDIKPILIFWMISCSKDCNNSKSKQLNILTNLKKLFLEQFVVWVGYYLGKTKKKIEKWSLKYWQEIK